MKNNRGEGIHPRTRYKWAKQPNGKITIFDVPIFAPFRREYTKESGEVVTEEITAEDFPSICREFETEKRTGHYPRVQIGHQDDYSAVNSPGVGYLDNLHVQDDMLWADLVEMKPSCHVQLLEGEIPYRSVGFNPARGEHGVIENLALLESRTPYFRLPMMFLEKLPLKATSQQISAFESRGVILKFQEDKQLFKKKKQVGDSEVLPPEVPSEEEEFEENLDEVVDDVDIDDVDDVEEETEPSMSDCMDRLDLVLKNVDMLSSRIAGIEKFIFEEDEDESEDEEPEDFEGGDLPEDEKNAVDSNDPAPIAFRSQEKTMKFSSEAGKAISATLQEMRKFQQEQAKNMDKRLAAIEGARQTTKHERRLKMICDANSQIDFESHRSQLLKFNAKGREHFLDYVEVSAQRHDEHPATASLRTFRADQKPAAGADYMQAFADKPVQLRKVATQAQGEYRETVNQFNESKARNFQTLHPTEKGFVEYCVNMEEEMGLGFFASNIASKKK